MEDVKYLLDTYGLVHHQLTSYDELVHHGICRIVSEESRVSIGNDAYIEIENPEMSLPSHTPNECRVRELTYDSAVYVTIRVVHPKRADVTARVLLVRLPVMLRSALCNLHLNEECLRDVGGYFIIRGKERVLVVQERNAYNTVVATLRTDGSVVAEMRSMSSETGHSVLTSASINAAGDKMVISIPFSSVKIPIGILLKAVGATDTDLPVICRPPATSGVGVGEKSAYARYIDAIVREASVCRSQEEAVEFISRHTMHISDSPLLYVRQVIYNELFPHLGPVTTPEQIVHVISQFVRALLLTKLGQWDGAGVGKDHIANKRYECAGVLIHDLLRTSYKRFVRALGPAVAKHNTVSISGITTIWSKLCPITKDLRYSFLTGSWGSRNSFIKTGVSQVLTRLSYVSFVAHLRRINIFVGREVKNVDIRHIHESSYGFIDVSETPEGVTVGVVKNLALFSYVTVETPRTLVQNILDTAIDGPGRLHPLGMFTRGTGTVVAVNNIPVGETRDAGAFVSAVRGLRAYGRLEYTVSVVHDAQMGCVFIWCDAGRLYRPLRALTQAQAQGRDRLVFFDVAEMDTLVVDGETLAEVHPISVLGLTCSLIPFADHNQAPRISYYSNMCKQAIGVYATNHNLRFDTAVHMLEHTQTPIVMTAISRMLEFDRMSSGIHGL
jgi:DNA-directed RNA polymerase II subunit RPB2